MQDLINMGLFYLKVIVLLIAFSLSLYISFMRVDYYNQSILNIIPLFLPFLLLLILFVFQFAFNKNNGNLLNNLSCVLAFIAIIIICIRTIFDSNIINSFGKLSFDFFTNQEVRMKLLLYLMLVGNLCLLYLDKKKIAKIHS